MNSFSVVPLGQTGVSDTLEQQYARLRQKCTEQYGEDFCNSVLPRNMVYAVTRRPEGASILPWWAWMIIGAFVGRVLRI